MNLNVRGFLEPFLRRLSKSDQQKTAKTKRKTTNTPARKFLPQKSTAAYINIVSFDFFSWYSLIILSIFCTLKVAACLQGVPKGLPFEQGIPCLLEASNNTTLPQEQF